MVNQKSLSDCSLGTGYRSGTVLALITLSSITKRYLIVFFWEFRGSSASVPGSIQIMPETFGALIEEGLTTAIAGPANEAPKAVTTCVGQCVDEFCHKLRVFRSSASWTCRWRYWSIIKTHIYGCNIRKWIIFSHPSTETVNTVDKNGFLDEF